MIIAKSSVSSRTPKAPDLGALLLLVRHGTTPTTGTMLPGRAPGLHLADTGRDQAQAVADRIAEFNRIDAIYASPLERTRETAKPIGKATSTQVKIERGLLECDFGEWTGQPLKKLMKLPEWTRVQRSPSGFRFPGGESFPEMQMRITSTLAKLADRHNGGVVVAVSHADPIKAAVAQALGIHLDLFQRIVISPCSITAIRLTGHGPIVLSVNSITGRLSDLQPS